MAERGFTLLEMLVVVAILLIALAVSAPDLRAYSDEAHLMGIGRTFEGEFRKAQSTAVRSLRNTAIVFDQSGENWSYSVYLDGNRNGVRRAEIGLGIDRRIAGPYPLTGDRPYTRLGINPLTPQIPPATGLLDPTDAIRFGNSDVLSFSELGTATPGTLYLAGRHAQAAIRVVAGTARVRLLTCRGGRWREH